MGRLLLRLLAGLVASVAVGGWTTAATAPAGDLGPVVDQRAERADRVTDRVADRVAGRVDRMSRRHRCSPDGLAAGVVPVEAIVLRVGSTGPRDVRLVSFERGWSTYLGERPGTLVAVCAG